MNRERKDKMLPNNLVLNGDFSNEFQNWTLEGQTQNAQIVTEDGNTFARFGPWVSMYQDITVETHNKYAFAFRFRAPYVGNGLTIKVQGLDATNTPVETLVQQAFHETDDWTIKGVILNSNQFQKIRLLFDIYSAADLDDVLLFVTGQPNQNGLFGNYYNGTAFNTLVFQRVDPIIDFNWPAGNPPTSGNQSLNKENYSIRWNGYLLAPLVPINQTNKKIIFRAISDDGVKLWLYPLNTEKPDPIINNWTIHPPQTFDSTPQSLAPGEFYNIEIEYYNAPQGGVIRLMYYFEGEDPQTAKTVPTEHLFPKIQ
ncbi:PA14 domain-containing protein [Bacillus toyonensis]|uniref:Uncharacterized protein n=1 Tax=Bacillus toyonensis TaxID=155322 RepID=A0A2A7Y7V3_9BACI|nr:PA14 domain-containing protein [Bacillus toyonensis]PEJ82965.1 hypothetical protein CN688_31840 [Bacillus toyonensis]PEK79409.1 hypothetical protein CN594_25365 [Bacillus toyonensis]PEL15797.1 hypothetical protein CN624_31165 [Bacillus toyonensis]PFY32671.1 hypothetical protein COL55_32585 [Bacillus toyonensis]PFY41140.1 hypothetical protein COL54_16950 [Bacillus toyonensis]